MGQVDEWVHHFSIGSRPYYCSRGSTSGKRGSEGTVHFPVFYQVILFHELEFTISLGSLLLF